VPSLGVMPGGEAAIRQKRPKLVPGSKRFQRREMKAMGVSGKMGADAEGEGV
jgi:hypothetical protein